MTGANGLLGKRVVLDLKMQGFEVYTLTRKPDPEKGVKNLVIDFSTNWGFSKLPSQIDGVIHLAQSNHYKDFPKYASDIFEVNVRSSAKLLDYARNANAQIFIYTSTGGVYGTSDTAFSESQAAQSSLPNNFYVSTKWSSEVFVQNYSKIFKTVIFRPFFIYGKGQDRSMLIPRLYDSVINGFPVKLSGQSGIKINPIHVSDASNAITLSLNSKNEHLICNLAGGQVISLRQICELFGNYLSKKPRFEILEKNSDQDIIGDITLLSNNLISPKVKLENILEEFNLN